MLTVASQAEKKRSSQGLLRFLMLSVFYTGAAMLSHKQAILELLFVLERAVVGALAHRALKLDHVFLGHSEGQKM